jgi:hypothetical protein
VIHTNSFLNQRKEVRVVKQTAEKWKDVLLPKRACYRFDHETLALFIAAWCVYPELSYRALYGVVVQIDPALLRRYKAKRGEAFTVNVLSNRIDKAIRQCELKNYRHLIPAAINKVETWKKRNHNNNE